MRSDKLKVHAAKCKEKEEEVHEEEQSAEQSAVGTKKARSAPRIHTDKNKASKGE